VTAKNKFGVAAATSALTAIIVAIPSPAPSTAPENASIPTISGQPVVGATLTASAGTWNGDSPISYSYTWNRCIGNVCSAIADATDSTYAPTVRDLDASLTVTVNASNSVGSATATSAPVRTSCPSGECVPLGDLPGWQQVFVEDFATAAPVGSFSDCTTTTHTCSGLPAGVRERWFAYPDGWTDRKTGTYSPSRVISIQNGLMNMYLHSEAGDHLISAPVPKIPGASALLGMRYGRYAARLRADPLHGYETAWLLWPDTEAWPRDGEINMPEGHLDGHMCMFLHHQNATEAGDQEGTCSTVTYTSWHTVVLEWLPTVANFYIDGELIMSSTSRIPDTSMHWVLQTDTAPCCEPSDTTAGNVRVDWVAVWKPA
jgi:hypothetical protein